MKYKALITLFTLLSMAGYVHAAGDAAAGKAKAAACVGCHGLNGNSINPAWPKLAGQHEKYIAKQLADFKLGKTRMEPLMVAQVTNLSAQDMADLGAYFAKQKAGMGSADKAKVEKGKKIYTGGNKASGVSACIACHGPTGTGNPGANFPLLGGQHAAYTTKALKDFRAGKRSNDQNRMMRLVAAKMTDAEIDAVASYISGLH